MRFIFEWVHPDFYPPRWMAFAYYSARRNRSLFVIPPINLLIALLWWLQDQWAMKAQRTSWIEEETRRRIERRCNQYR